MVRSGLMSRKSVNINEVNIMRFIADRPVTIERVHYGERWFPFFYRLPDGMLMLSIEYNFDIDFAPHFQMRSIDGGKTWTNPQDNVPRQAWCHGFADGEMFEIDTYGIQDPNAPSDAVYFGCWSYPSRPNDIPSKDFVRVHNHSQRGASLAEIRGCPTYRWWRLWNTLHNTDMLSAQDIRVSGPYFTGGFEMPDGRLMAVGYWSHPAIYQSRDRGHTWDEVGVICDPAQGGPQANEAALQRLRDGRFYVVMRTEDNGPRGGPLVHAWSEDEGRTWSHPEPIHLEDEPEHRVAYAWPAMTQLDDGSLILVYGRPGKNLVIDPTGTGRHWQGRFDLHAWELDTQALNGVPSEWRLRGIVGEDWSKRFDRHTDSGDYLSVVATGLHELLVVYDVHAFIENWNSNPISGVRMVRIRLVEKDS